MRPIMMVAEVEPPEGLSARKLVLETGKFNVITAYSVEETFETLGVFPRVDAVVLHASLCKEMECDLVVAEIKRRHPDKVVITLSPTSSQNYKLADHQLSSHEPQLLLNLLRERFGDPRLPEEKL